MTRGTVISFPDVDSEEWQQTLVDMHPRSSLGGALKSEDNLAELGGPIVRQRRKVKRFRAGDVVEVYSSKRQKWFLDGIVMEVAHETGFHDGVKVGAGSIKVVYDHGTTFKWVPLQQMQDEQYLRASPRPRPPDPKVGVLSKESTAWLGALQSSQKAHAELQQGFLQWWNAQADADAGAAAAGSVYLLGLELHRSGVVLNFHTDDDLHVYAFKAESGKEAAAWAVALQMHAEYCEEVRAFYERKVGRRGSRDSEFQTAIERREHISVVERRHAQTRFAHTTSFQSVSTSGTRRSVDGPVAPSTSMGPSSSRTSVRGQSSRSPRGGPVRSTLEAQTFPAQTSPPHMAPLTSRTRGSLSAVSVGSLSAPEVSRRRSSVSWAPAVDMRVETSDQTSQSSQKARARTAPPQMPEREHVRRGGA